MKGWHKNSSGEAKQFFQVREDLLSWQRTAQENRLTDAATLISQGAEGKVYYSTFLGRNVVTKERVIKNYRVAALDAKLNRTRLLHEARCMVKGRQLGLDVPIVHMVDTGAYKIVMEKLDGVTLKALLHRDMSIAAASAAATSSSSSSSSGTSTSRCAADINLNSNSNSSANVYTDAHLQLAACVGRAIATLHAADIVHGDLTTSNIMIRNRNSNSNSNGANNNSSSNSVDATQAGAGAGAGVVLIDFGLGSMQAAPEDKAVDLYVLERAFLATHPGSEPLVAAVMEAYAALYAPSAVEGAEGAEEQASKKLKTEEAPVTPAAAAAAGGGGKGSKKGWGKVDKDSDEAKHDKCQAVLKRLEAVRMRGRKRDMFG